jgi:anti-sigma factor (TIGR02949 family)
MTEDDCSTDMSGHNCDEAIERLYEYLDSELDEMTTEGIRGHLDACGGCNNGYDFERRLKVVVREHLSEEVPEEFLIRLRHVIDREANRL